MKAFTLRRSDIDRCPLRSLDPEHYYRDGVCRCSRPDRSYYVIRFCANEEHPDHRRIIARRLTEEQAQAHCNLPHTKGEDEERGRWFDGFDHVRSAR